jgi:RHS repeat-associated protein
MKRISAQPYQSALLVALFCLCLGTETLAQNIQQANDAMDIGMRSSRKVNPTTLGMELQIPLGEYKGRGGLSVPVVLSYSSKLWGMEFQSYVQGPPPPHGGIQPFTIVTARYSKNSINGWSSSVNLPGLDFTPGDRIHNADGSPNTTGNCTAGCFKIDRMLVWMPDGSAHELRASDQPRNVTAPLPDDYWAVDGSRMRYQRSTGILFFPDGTRVVGLQQIDRNGNTLTAVTGGLRDTLGRVINNPLSFGQGFGVGDHAYTLPGVNGSTLNYTFVWKNLVDVMTTPEPLRFKGSAGCPPGSGGTFSPFLFASELFSRTCIGNSSELFNPVVLHQIVLPNDQTYTFTYNVYGEIDKIVLPTGAYERFVYAQVAAIGSNLSGVYAQPNRGVIRHVVSESGSGADEVEWLYSSTSPGGTGTGTLVTMTAPDGTRTEANLWPDGASSWGYSVDGSRAGRPFDERVYAPSGQMIRRKLTQWAMTGSNAAGNFSGTESANRNARMVKMLEFILDTDGGPALGKTTTYGYDLTHQFTVGIDQTSVNEFAYLDVDQNTAQTLSINSLPTFSTGTRLRTTETDYLTSDVNYRSRNILGLTSATRVKDALNSDKIVAQSSFAYDEYGEQQFPLLSYASVSDWTDPQTGFRGNVTSISRWVNFDGANFVNFPFGVYLTTHTQYDQCGSARKIFDAGDTALLNPTLIDYSVDFKRAYPTTSTSADPDLVSTTENGPLAPLEATTEYDFNTGRVVATVDPNLQRTTFSYDDPLNRLKQVVRAALDSVSKNQTTYTYNDADRTVTITSDLTTFNDNALKSMKFFDRLGRVTETRQFESATDFITTLQEYDDFGRVLRKSNPHRTQSESANWTTTAYDALSRVISLTLPDNTVITTAYSGNQVLSTDQNLRRRLSRSDSLGRLSETWEIRPSDSATESVSFPNHPDVTAGYATRYSYDATGNLLLVTQRLGTAGTTQSRTFSYDSDGRLLTAVQPESGATSYRYDNVGNLTTKTDARNPAVTTTTNYDALNRITSRSYSDGTPTVTYAYDLTVPNAKGRVTSVSSSVSTYSYTEYDALGLIRSTKQSTDGQDYIVDYTYDLAGHLKTETYPSGRIVAMDYDAAGRLAGVQNQGGQFYAGAVATDETNRIQYSSHGPISKIRFGNALWEHANFNARLQTTQIGLGTAATNSSVLQLDFDYGTTTNNGNVQGHTITLPGLTLTQTYTYDPLNRLETANEDSGSSWKQKFTYDRYGNRRIDSNLAYTSADLVGPNPVLSELNNRILPQSGELYLYDGAGNLTRGKNGETYAFDAENKMTSFNGGAATYSYDGDGKRVKKVVGSVTTVFVYDASDQLLAEYTDGTSGGAGTSYFTGDHLGSPRVITDANGGVKARHDYHPFGEDVGLKGGRNADPLKYVTDTVRQKFTGKERDAETGLDYFNARYYASTQGRFTSADPLLASGIVENPQSWNRYSYVLNNPLRLIDPDGLYVFDKDVDPEQRKKFNEALAQARGNLQQIGKVYGTSSKEYKNAERALNAYGDEGVNNGVTILPRMERAQGERKLKGWQARKPLIIPTGRTFE